MPHFSARRPAHSLASLARLVQLLHSLYFGPHCNVRCFPSAARSLRVAMAVGEPRRPHEVQFSQGSGDSDSDEPYGGPSAAQKALQTALPCLNWGNVNLVGAAAALTYAAVSIALGMINKFVLTEYLFPDSTVIVGGQIVFTAVTFATMGHIGAMPVDPFNAAKIRRCAPLAAVFCLNALFSLAAMRSVSMPMYTTLRRMSVLFVLLGEWLVLHKTPSRRVVLSIAVAVVGTLIAGAADLSFDVVAYLIVLGANVCSSLFLIIIKRSASSDGLTNEQMLYGANVLSLPLAFLIFAVFTDRDALRAYPHWGDSLFVTCFLLALSLGAALNLTSFWSVRVNSAVTQAVTGQAKNFVSFFISFALFSDYRYSPTNMLGMLVAMVGALLVSTRTNSLGDVSPPPRRPSHSPPPLQYGHAKYRDRADAAHGAAYQPVTPATPMTPSVAFAEEDRARWERGHPSPPSAVDEEEFGSGGVPRRGRDHESIALVEDKGV